MGILTTLACLPIDRSLAVPLGMYGAAIITALFGTIGNTVAHARYTFRPTHGVRPIDALLAGGSSFLIIFGLITFVLVVKIRITELHRNGRSNRHLLATTIAAFARFMLFRAAAFGPIQSLWLRVKGDPRDGDLDAPFPCRRPHLLGGNHPIPL